MIARPKILVFDSGAGGLSIAKEILEKRPGCHLVYAADQAYFPYGLKTDADLSQRVVSQVEALYHRYAPALVVIACNTASTLALDSLRAEFPCPFVGVVPAIKPAAAATKSGVIGMLATSATVNRPYTQNLIDEFASNHKVLRLGSDALVELAEQKITGKAVDVAAIHQELQRLFRQPCGNEIDTVVLACTHFPLLKLEFEQWSKREQKSIHWIDSGEAIAKRVVQLLGREDAKLKTIIEFTLLEEKRVKFYREFLQRYV